jgi:hypothetical protein
MVRWIFGLHREFLDRTSPQGGVDPWLQIVAGHAKVVI